MIKLYIKFYHHNTIHCHIKWRNLTAQPKLTKLPKSQVKENSEFFFLFHPGISLCESLKTKTANSLIFNRHLGNFWFVCFYNYEQHISLTSIGFSKFEQVHSTHLCRRERETSLKKCTLVIITQFLGEKWANNRCSPSPVMRNFRIRHWL